MPDTLATSSAAPAATPAAAPQFPSPFADVAAGTVPAISLAPIENRKTDEAQEFAVQNLDALKDAGVEYFELSDAHSVFFNPAKISLEQIEAADKVGKLFEVAPLAKTLTPVATAAAPAPVAAPASPLATSQAVVPPGRAGGQLARSLVSGGVNDPVGALSSRAA